MSHVALPLSRFVRERAGNVLIETAAVVPILVMLLLGGFEAGRYFLVGQKLQRTAMTVADLASRTETLSAADIDDLFAAAAEVGNPFAFTLDGRVLVSSVEKPDTAAATVAWQRARGSGSGTSHIGAEGETATLSDTSLVPQGQSVIVAEVAFEYEPILSDLFDTQPMYAQATFRPRFSRTVTLE